MPVHHVALATKDMARIHGFYTEAMGFELVKTVVEQTPSGGWSKHVFFAVPDGGLVAFWDLHDDTIGDAWPVGMSTGVGLPWWVNHLAFTATLEDLEVHKKRWLAWGTDVLMVDHEFCVSLYTLDPDGNGVEWCADRRRLDARDRAGASRDMLAASPPFAGEQEVKGFWTPDRYHPDARRLL